MLYKAAYDIWSAFYEFNDQALTFGLVAVIIYSIVVIADNVIRFAKGIQTNSVTKIIVKLCLFTLFGMYASYAISLTLSGREAGSRSGYLNLVPFETIFSNGSVTKFTVENWLLFVPFGILVPMIWKPFRNFLGTGILGFFSSVFIETVQLVTKRGYFEIDDIIVNSVGAVCGYVIFAYCYEGFLGIRTKLASITAVKRGKTPAFESPCDRFIVSRPVALFLLMGVPVVLCIKMILGFSSDTGDASRQLSRPVAYGAAGLMAKLFKGVTIPENIDAISIADGENLFLDMTEKVIRKVAHVAEYAMLAVTIWVLIFTIRKLAEKWSYILCIALALIVGIIDECNQTSVSGRFGSPIDVCVDMCGAMLATLVIWLIIRKAKAHYDSSPPPSGCLYL